MLRFAHFFCFSGKRRFGCGESWLARATVLGVVALQPNPVRFVRAVELRVPVDFFSSLLTLLAAPQQIELLLAVF
jgi:hypothetical protein